MKGFIRAVIVVLVLFMLPVAHAEEEPREAIILDMEGAVYLLPKGGERMEAEVGMKIDQRTLLVTKAGSWAYVRIDGLKQARVEVKENSQLLFYEMLMDKEKKNQSTLLDLAIGKILVRVEELESDKPNFEVKTPTTVIGTMGKGESTFSVEVEAVE